MWTAWVTSTRPAYRSNPRSMGNDERNEQIQRVLREMLLNDFLLSDSDPLNRINSTSSEVFS